MLTNMLHIYYSNARFKSNILLSWLLFQVRRATRVASETLEFLVCRDRRVHLALGVQMACQDWMDSRVFVTEYFVFTIKNIHHLTSD